MTETRIASTSDGVRLVQEAAAYLLEIGVAKQDYSSLFTSMLWMSFNEQSPDHVRAPIGVIIFHGSLRQPINDNLVRIVLKNLPSSIDIPRQSGKSNMLTKLNIAWVELLLELRKDFLMYQLQKCINYRGV